jgi:hypothetical protein
MVVCEGRFALVVVCDDRLALGGKLPKLVDELVCEVIVTPHKGLTLCKRGRLEA